MRKTQMIILAGGSGERFGANVPKQFVKVSGKTIIEHTLNRIDNNEKINSVIIVINPDFYDYMNQLIIKNNFLKVKKVIKGGKTRQESSYAGLMACDSNTENVLFHDAIRPFVSDKIINDTIEALEKYEAVDVAIPSADTLVKVDDDNIITDIPKRKYLMRGQTPQGFRIDIIKKAYDLYLKKPIEDITDDCGLIVKYNLGKVFVVTGEEKNIKITYKEDAYLADKLFQLNSSEILLNDKSYYNKLNGKIGIVFGHSSGIGEAVLNLAKEHNCTVYGFSRKNGYDVTNCKCVEKALKQVYEKEGKIDYVIVTAGVLKVCKFDAMSNDDINNMIAINYTAPVNITKIAINYLKESKGSIVLFTSSSYTRGRAMYSIYSSTKAAIVNFVQAISEEYNDFGIKINVINPERTDTPMRRNNFGIEPKQTLLTASEVAEFTLKTVTENITGQVVDVRKNRSKN